MAFADKFLLPLWLKLQDSLEDLNIPGVHNYALEPKVQIRGWFISLVAW